MISQFLNKQGEAAIYIAKRFLALNTGDRIPNLSDMSAEAGSILYLFKYMMICVVQGCVVQGEQWFQMM